jgi:DTW domain-containing protein YfiP
MKSTDAAISASPSRLIPCVDAEHDGFDLSYASSSTDSECASSTPASSTRDLCPRCTRPPRVCICASLPAHSPLRTPNIRIVVLQTRAESRVAVGTARLLPLVLEHAVVHVVCSRKLPDGLLSADSDGPSSACTTVLLFPGSSSVPLDELAYAHSLDGIDASRENATRRCFHNIRPLSLPPDRHLAEPRPTYFTIVLLDGSWDGAHKMLKKCKELQTLRQVRLPERLVAQHPPLFTARRPPANIPGTPFLSFRCSSPCCVLCQASSKSRALCDILRATI